MALDTTSNELPEQNVGPSDDPSTDLKRRQTQLLSELRIDRSESDVSAVSKPWLRRSIAIVVVATFAVAGAIWLGDPPEKETQTQLAAAGAHEPIATPDSVGVGRSTLEASGYVVARRQATVSAKITGKVVELLIEEGQSVSADQVIARLDDAQQLAQLRESQARLAHAEASFAASDSALVNARSLYDRMQRLHAGSYVSDQDFEDARTTYEAAEDDRLVKERAVEVASAGLEIAERAYAETVVRAPFDGIVTVKAAQPGEIVSPLSGGGFTRTGIGTIVDMSSLEVEIDVSENFLPRVRPGQDAEVTLNAYPDWRIPASVIAIVPTADRAKATVKVRVELLERDDRVLPDMGVRVRFLADGRRLDNASSASAAAVTRPLQTVAADTADTTVGVATNGPSLQGREHGDPAFRRAH